MSDYGKILKIMLDLFSSVFVFPILSQQGKGIRNHK